MKLKSVAAFEKQLRESAPGHFSRVYLVLVADSYERKFYVKKLYQFLLHYRPKLGFTDEIEEGLFSEERVIHLEVENGVKPLPREGIIIYSGEKCSAAFYEAIEKEVICLDLSLEKPWEKKERLIEELQKVARSCQKNLSLQVANRLVEQVGSDFALLKNEVEKLSLFVGDRKLIQDIDIEEVTLTEKEVTAWQVAEALVWKNKEIPRQEFRDLSEVLALIALVRHHAYLGLQVCRGETASLRKNQIDLYLPFCEKVGPYYFVRRLLFLFEWEVKAKSSSFDPTILWDLLVIHYDAIPTAEPAPSRS